MTHPLGSFLISTSWKSASKPLSVSRISPNSFRCAYTKANTTKSSTTKFSIPSTKRNCVNSTGNNKGYDYFVKNLITNGKDTSQCAVHKLNCSKGLCSCNYCFVDCMFKLPSHNVETEQSTASCSSSVLLDEIEYFLSKSKSSPFLLQKHANLEINHDLAKPRLCSSDITVDKDPLLANVLMSKEDKMEPADDPKQKILLLKEALRSDIPGFFEKKKNWHDFSWYTPNIELNVAPLRDVDANYKIRGVKPYKYAMSTFRRSLLLYLSHPSLDLLRIEADVDKRTIEARWKISGWTPLAFLTTLILKLTNVPWEIHYMSTLYINSDGKIWRHDIERVQKLSDLPPLPRLRNILRQRAYAVYSMFKRETSQQAQQEPCINTSSSNTTTCR